MEVELSFTCRLKDGEEISLVNKSNEMCGKIKVNFVQPIVPHPGVNSNPALRPRVPNAMQTQGLVPLGLPFSPGSNCGKRPRFSPHMGGNRRQIAVLPMQRSDVQSHANVRPFIRNAAIPIPPRAPFQSEQESQTEPTRAPMSQQTPPGQNRVSPENHSEDDEIILIDSNQSTKVESVPESKNQRQVPEQVQASISGHPIHQVSNPCHPVFQTSQIEQTVTTHATQGAQHIASMPNFTSSNTFQTADTNNGFVLNPRVTAPQKAMRLSGFLGNRAQNVPKPDFNPQNGGAVAGLPVTNVGEVALDLSGGAQGGQVTKEFDLSKDFLLFKDEGVPNRRVVSNHENVVFVEDSEDDEIRVDSQSKLMQTSTHQIWVHSAKSLAVARGIFNATENRQREVFVLCQVCGFRCPNQEELKSHLFSSHKISYQLVEKMLQHKNGTSLM